MDDRQSKASELNAGIRASIEQLANETDAARQSELFRNYLKTSAAFYDYSWHNQMLIWRQRPDATFVAGFNGWLIVETHPSWGSRISKFVRGYTAKFPSMFPSQMSGPKTSCVAKRDNYRSEGSDSL